MKISKIIFALFCIIGAIGCGPSPESLAKKNCELYKKYNQAQKDKDVVSILKLADEIDQMDKKIIADHKSNPDWVNTYVLERNACILEVMKDTIIK